MSIDFLLHDVLGRLNYIDRIEGLFSAIRHGDYRHAEGVAGILNEFVQSVGGANTHKFSMPRRGRHSLNEVEAQLRKYGITVFGRTHDGNYMHFHVKRRQARWAEYIMLHAGVELVGPLFDSRNAGYKDSHAPGWMPAPWSESERREQAAAKSFGASILDWFDGGRHSGKTPSSPPSGSLEGGIRPDRQSSASISQHHTSHRNSGPAREPGGWLDRLDALIDDYWEP